MSKLALLGGRPVRRDPFPPYRTIGEEERRAVNEVLDRGILSQFLGTYHEDFWGGPKVRELERAWCEHFGSAHAVAMNSATSGLYAAAGAVGVSPGDEVIVTPYTMCASATAALVYGAVPVFADIEPDTFCIDPASVRARVTSRTRAIVAVDIFGQPADFQALRAIAREFGLALIEDAAQAPAATLEGRHAGTLADVGVFSLNYHKHIHTGEGGVVVTNDEGLARRLQLIRNHAEAVVRGMGVTDLVNMVGFNYRMTEIEAAIGLEQLKKLNGLVEGRVEMADYLSGRLSGLPGLRTPAVRDAASHVYYVYALRYDAGVHGPHRNAVAEALRAEGIPVGAGYVLPLYLEPLYQQRVAFGPNGYPFRQPSHSGLPNYERGLCPVAEKAHFEEVITISAIHSQVSRTDMDDIAAAFEKVLENAGELRAWEGTRR